MAERPVFIPVFEGKHLVKEVFIEFSWHSGMSASQKKKNVVALHDSAHKLGLNLLLEISTKSEEKIGQRLSAFSLKVDIGEKIVPLESAYQGSKIFERGGPYQDIYDLTPSEAKHDERTKNSGEVVGFRFGNDDYPINPKTVFYDWLYMKAIYPHKDFLKRIHKYSGFTDIEFNPSKSINCQARTCAMFVAMDKRDILDECMKSFSDFKAFLSSNPFEISHKPKAAQTSFV